MTTPKTPMKLFPVSPAQTALREALQEVFRAAAEDAKMDVIEILAVGCNVIGRLVAMQDQTKYTGEMVMDLVFENIVQDNHEVIQALLAPMEPTGTRH